MGMGYIRHHAIVVTSWNTSRLEQARATAVELGVAVSNVVESPINGFESFFVAPDGSKEGWADSDEGDMQRHKFVEWLENERYDDGSTSLAWAEVRYGDDNGIASLVRASDEALTTGRSSSQRVMKMKSNDG